DLPDWLICEGADRAAAMSGTALESEKRPARRQPSRRSATVMFADMVGYSDRLQRDQTRNTAQAVKSIRLFKSLIADYNGKVANVAGDGLLALFSSPTDALNFAIEVQRSFHEQAVWSDGDPIKFRIALSCGEITVKNRNVHGH